MKSNNFNIHCISNGNEFLSEYGPDKEEIGWTTDRKARFKMSYDSAKKRLQIVKQFWPNARIIICLR